MCQAGRCGRCLWLPTQESIEDRVVRGPHQIALNREQERAAVRVHGLGLEPALVRRPVVRRGLREERRAVERRDDLRPRARRSDSPTCLPANATGIPCLHDASEILNSAASGRIRVARCHRARRRRGLASEPAPPRCTWSARRHWAVIWGIGQPGGDAVDIEGRAERKPWMASPPAVTRKRRPCRVSTPSATTLIASAGAAPCSASATICSVPGWPLSPCVGVRCRLDAVDTSRRRQAS